MTFSEYNLSNILHFPTFNGFIANNQIFFRTKFWMLKDSLSVLFFKQACLKPVMAMGIDAMNLNMAVYSNLYFLFDRWFQLKIYDLKRGHKDDMVGGKEKDISRISLHIMGVLKT